MVGRGAHGGETPLPHRFVPKSNKPSYLPEQRPVPTAGHWGCGGCYDGPEGIVVAVWGTPWSCSYVEN